MRENKTKSGPVILVVDYGAGNLRSVAKAFEKLDCDVYVSASPSDIPAADAIILPGQGAAKPTMDGLRYRGLIDPICEYISSGGPFFGICIGLQVLLRFSDEGDQECLGILSGKVQRLPQDLKVPHIGWNEVYQSIPNPLF